MSYFIQHLGYIFTFLAISIKDVLWLRIVLAIAQTLLGIYQWMENRIDVVVWNSIFTIINCYHIYRIKDERTPIKIPDEIKDIYINMFKNFTTKEFINFWNLGDYKIIKNSQIVFEGKKQEHLLLILSGEASVIKENKVINTLGRGKFVGEMSLITNEPASADIISKNEIKYIMWDQQMLKHFEQTNKDLWIKLHNILSKDLIDKIKVFSSN
tara:strand:+ start:208 stop:843 length:636 start_codon:yes stop_codon:yes gene_type:complete